MGVGEAGPEPTGWELMRGLELVRGEISQIGGRVVSAEVYNADKLAAGDRMLRAEARLRDLETNAVEGEKLKRSQRLTISLAIASPVVAAVIGWITSGGLVR